MRSLVHLSDLHFGRIDATIIAPLIRSVTEIKPDVIAISGDLTQRAREEQFRKAREFLDALPRVPQIVVPGNHDVPLYNVFQRFAAPLVKFRRHITNDLRPFFADSEIAVLGLNTARSLTFKYGRINERQMAHTRERLCDLSNEITKIIVTHHPFDVPEGHDERDLVGRAQLAMQTLVACGADVLLAGHLHVSATSRTAERYQTSGHSALVVQAGTATSTRGRGETNSFNVLRIQHPHIKVTRFAWQSERATFVPASSENFMRTAEGWTPISDEVAAGIVFDEQSDGLQSNDPLHVVRN